MNLHSIAVFLHVLGALGLFAALGIEWAAAEPLRRTRDAGQARQWIRLLGSLRRIGGPSAGTLLLTGIYLARFWGGQAWIGLSLLGLVFVALLAMGVTGRRIGAIARELGSAGSTDAALGARLGDPALVISLRVRTAAVIGIVFLMTSKPAAGIAIAVLGGAVALGLAWSVYALSRRRGIGVEPAQ